MFNYTSVGYREFAFRERKVQHFRSAFFSFLATTFQLFFPTMPFQNNHFSRVQGKTRKAAITFCWQLCVIIRSTGCAVQYWGTTLKGKTAEEPLSRAAYVRFYSNKVKDNVEKQVTHTYPLIEARRFMEATKWNKEKIDIISFQVVESFYRVFLSVCFPVKVSHFTMFLSRL